MNILPTGTPFDDTLLFFEALMPPKFRHLLQDPGYTARYRIVHAICRSSEDITYCTAWVEQGPLAWSCAIIEGCRAFYALSCHEHYSLVGARQIVRYTLEAAFSMLLLSGHTGPWDSTMVELCQETMEVIGSTHGPQPLVIIPIDEIATVVASRRTT